MKQSRMTKSRVLLGMLVAVLLGMLAAALAAADQVASPAASPSPGPSASQGGSQAEELKLITGKSLVIDRASDVARVSITNPDVIDAVAVSSREILVNAKALGYSTLVIWSRAGDRAFFAVTVEPYLEPLRQLLQETFPGEELEVRARRDAISLVGRASSQAVADRALALSVPFAKTVVNNLQVGAAGGEKQILLRVKFAELNRAAETSFGLNLISTGALNTPGRIGTGQFAGASPGAVNGTIPGTLVGAATSFTLSDALNIFAFRPDLNLGAILRDLQTQGLLQILAEPNLITTNGKEASFLVGGEFPVPVVQGGANAGSITVQFREYGIRLAFLPVLTNHQTIKLHVKPEVSTIDLANSVVFGGFTIPALASRRIETDVELGEGQSFVIGGLLDERVTENLARLPGLANIPVLGALFKSRSLNKAKTELVVMVTPEIAVPRPPSEQVLPVMPHEFLPPAVKDPPARRAKP